MTIPVTSPPPIEGVPTAAPGVALQRLARAGFVPAGAWNLAGTGIAFRLQESAACATPALYAFVVDGEPVYIGKTSVPLRQRLNGYRSPARDPRNGASTNRLNHRRIADALQGRQAVDIWVFTGTSDMRHGEFELDLPAALERAMIASLATPWNQAHRRQHREPATVLQAVATPPITSAMPIAPAGRSGDTVTPTVQALLDFARGKQGTELYTLTRPSAFRVEVAGNCLEFIPTSGKPRREGMEAVAKVLGVFATTGSWRRSDYIEESFNASYLLALIKGWQTSQQAHTAT